jgi:thiol-disulfide isomerase/thioredoxin
MLGSLDAAPVWLNSEPLTEEGLRGHTVAVQFWTYSCVNWLRTLPYVSAWAERYAERGLVVVGAHAPEFGFEHDLANVRRAVADLGIAYPVVIDNEFAIWRAFGNRYWPALYVFDDDGRPRFEHFGEESYVAEEQAIQALLGVEDEVVQLEAGGLSAPADWAHLRTPETYVAEGGGPGWQLDGRWATEGDFAVLEEAPGSIAYRFEARDVNLVMGGAEVPFTVRLDGEPPGEDHGLDADGSGEGAIAGPRMYQLVRQRAAARRRFEITFHEPGARAYVFTFG